MKSVENILSSKYFILLSSLTSKEVDGLLELSNCYIFNPSPKIHQLISLTTRSKAISKKHELYEIIFLNTTFDDRKLRNLLSRAFKLVSKFIAYQYFEDNENKFQDTYIDSFKEKKLDIFIDNRIENWERKLKQNTFFGDDYILEQLKFNDIKFHTELKYLSNSKRNFNLDSHAYNKSLDESFLLQKMKFFISSFNYQSLVNSEEEFTMLDEIILFVNSKKDWNKIVFIQFHLLMLQHKPEIESHYKELLKYFDFIDNHLPLNKKREIYLLIQNYTIKKINNGKIDYLQELFNLFKVMLRNKTIFEDNVLSQWSYTNIVTVALRINETVWCIEFFEKYRAKLGVKERENTYQLVKAKYCFFVNEYENAIKAIKKTNFEDSISLINAKTIEIKSYFELDEFDHLLKAIEYLDKILQRRRKLSTQYLKRYKNFNKFLKKIIKTVGVKEKKILFEKISNEKAIINKKWLLEKLI